MKKEEIITFFIIIIIIAGNIVTQNYTKKCVHETSEELSSIKSQAISKEKSDDEFTSELEELYNNWEQKNEKLAYYIEHDELEKVNTQIRASKAYFEAGLTEDAIPELEKGIYILEHIKEKQAFNLKNIF